MRRAPITPLPPELGRLVDVLHQVLGFVTPLVCLTLLRSEAGETLTPASGAGTTLLGGRETVDWLDTGADEWRLVGYGVDTGDVGIAVRYVVNGVVLAAADVPAALGTFVGPWTRIAQSARVTVAGDQVGGLVVIGDGVGGTTLHSVTVQARTASRMA